MLMYEYGNPASSIILIQMVDDHDLKVIENEVAAIKKSVNDFKLVAVKTDNWNTDLSPWEAPAVFGKEGFSGGATRTLTTTANAKYVIVQFDGLQFDRAIYNLQFELGNTATFSKAHSAVYGGDLNLLTGELTLTHYGCTYTGEESWSVQFSSTNESKGRVFRQGSTLAHPDCKGTSAGSSSTNGYCFCSHYGSRSITSGTGSVGFTAYNTIIQFRPPNVWTKTVTDWKNFVKAQYKAGTPLQVVYTLKTPITYQLTANQMRTLLDHNNIFSDSVINTTCEYEFTDYLHFIRRRIMAFNENLIDPSKYLPFLDMVYMSSSNDTISVSYNKIRVGLFGTGPQATTYTTKENETIVHPAIKIPSWATSISYSFTSTDLLYNGYNVFALWAQDTPASTGYPNSIKYLSQSDNANARFNGKVRYTVPQNANCFIGLFRINRDIATGETAMDIYNTVGCSIKFNKTTTKTVYWNNLVNGYLSSDDWKDRDTSESTTTFSNGIATTSLANSPGTYHTMMCKNSPAITLGNLYYVRAQFCVNYANPQIGVEYAGGKGRRTTFTANANEWVTFSYIDTGNRTGSGILYLPNVQDTYISDKNDLTVITKNVLYIDLTLMFGAGNEPASVTEFENLCTLNNVNLNQAFAMDVSGTATTWTIP